MDITESDIANMRRDFEEKFQKELLYQKWSAFLKQHSQYFDSDKARGKLLSLKNY